MLSDWEMLIEAAQQEGVLSVEAAEQWRRYILEEAYQEYQERDQDNDVFSDKKTKGKNIDTSYIDNEDDEESGSGANSNDEEEVGDEVIEAITTPGTGSSKRKALNFISDSSTPSKKPKRKAVAETPTKTKPKSTTKAADEKVAQKGRRTKA